MQTESSTGFCGRYDNQNLQRKLTPIQVNGYSGLSTILLLPATEDEAYILTKDDD